ncbi:GNAT family N-acetyltransferase [Tunicatimonas pelagia]|uniref:GNAT family N-acetyltransferase n=1 Tax=Tunicatimonas pelagia TaxID=931531 RepID=UPI002666CFB2|nr:GNAT family N-acetyltransferase [Tunicatimonas pelagia]WKN41168.1 GNAT family N-acetyltransferase [Tunicatimonas pelagia]
MNSTIRNISPADVPGLKAVIDSSELFPSELLDDMIADYFNTPSSEDIWLTKDEENTPVAVAYCAPEKMTEGTYNLYLIAVRKEYQGKGIGAEMMRYIEEHLRTNGHRVLIVETSGLPEFKPTRKFYDNCGYVREAIIRDFYQEGEDKVVFWKKLN